jgi:hypothetical protein
LSVWSSFWDCSISSLGKHYAAKATNCGGLIGRKVMEWFSQKTSIAGIQMPNWGIVLGAAIVILLIYTSMH